MFEQALLPSAEKGARGLSLMASLSLQMAMVGAAFLVPLFFIEALPLVRLNRALIAPPVPPPPPHIRLVPVPANWAPPQIRAGRLYAPPRVPERVNHIVDQELPDAGAVEGSVQTAGLSGPNVVGSISTLVEQFSNRPVAAPPEPKPVAQPAPPPAPVGPVRVGGDVQTAKLIKQVKPPYPPLAKQARIQGTVKLMGVISKEGTIVQLQVLSGHPLLVQAAVDAVRQWVYRPTYLNREPVEVIAPIDVHFTLSQ